jgi:hypothetical protein
LPNLKSPRFKIHSSRCSQGEAALTPCFVGVPAIRAEIPTKPSALLLASYETDAPPPAHILRARLQNRPGIIDGLEKGCGSTTPPARTAKNPRDADV